jgi:hypothetical protein
METNLTETATPVATRNCWVCGNPADSREHKFKKSDLMRSSRTWTSDDLPYFVGGEGWRRIQGPKSKLVTFDKVLCSVCNSTRTQPFDRAYERFSSWASQKGAALMTESQIDFRDIYGAEYRTGVSNLLKFFIKHLGCRIATDNFTLPSALAASLSGSTFAPFEVTIARNRELHGHAIRGPGVLGNYALFGSYSSSTGRVGTPYLSGVIVGHLDIVYRYDWPTRYSWEGDPVTSMSPVARIGLCSNDDAEFHFSNGAMPGSDIDRNLLVGNRTFLIPALSREHMQSVLSLPRPNDDMSLGENIDARIRITLAILSPLFPDITAEFIQKNMSIPDTDRLWGIVFRP